MSQHPSVLFVCVKNGGKSQLAGALLRRLAGSTVEVLTAGTKPGTAVNSEAAASLLEIGASLEGEAPKPIDPTILTRVDRVVVLGSEAVVEPVPGMRAAIEVWETDEPSSRGIEGMERMRLVRDDIAARVRTLHRELTDSVAPPSIRVFEPALCCNTGVCGPDVDEALVRFTADLAHLRSRGVDIARHNLANDPGVFANTPAVAGFLRAAGSSGLPLVLVDGVTVATGRYPGRDELTRLAQLPDESGAPAHKRELGLTEAPASSSACCSGDTTGCC